MWRNENGQTFLDLSAVDRSEFKIVSENGLHLVYPKKNKWDWTEKEKWLRSVMVDDNGLIVSCSWKKFGNFGEFLIETDELKAVLAAGGTVRFTHKEDGSLMIRSVVRNQVIMRTRGTMFGGESDDGSETYGEKFRRVAVAKYPKLLDPTWMANGVSLLFEYVAPDNAIVVRYKEEDLVFLGGVNHMGPSIILWDGVVKIANEGNLRLVDLKELPSDPVKLLEEIKEWRTEGVVARCCNDQVFVKVKSAWYLANHRMKYSMKYKTIVEFVELSGVSNEDELVAKLREYDYDFEVVEGGREFYKHYAIARDEALALRFASEELHRQTIEQMGTILFSTEASKRKHFAQIACVQQPSIKSMMFAFYDGRTERLDAMVRKLVLTEGGKHK